MQAHYLKQSQAIDNAERPTQLTVIVVDGNEKYILYELSLAVVIQKQFGEFAMKR